MNFVRLKRFRRDEEWNKKTRRLFAMRSKAKCSPVANGRGSP